MKDIKLKCSYSNPLAELSEFRLDYEVDDGKLDLLCRLGFATMSYFHDGTQFEIGVSHAFLRLTLEGCETTVDKRYGDSLLAPVIQEGLIEKKSSVGLEATSGLSQETVPGFSAGVKANSEAARSQKFSQSLVHSPVRSRPNNSWEIQPVKLAGSPEEVIEGTAIPGERLCSVRRRSGGNRLSVIGEVHVAKSKFSVKAKGGNRLGRTMTEWRNKDAVVGQLLKKAIQREVASNNSADGEFVAISRCEIVEE